MAALAGPPLAFLVSRQGGAEENEQEDDAGGSADGGAPDAVAQQVQRFDDAVGFKVQMTEVAGKQVSEEGVGEGHEGDDDERPVGHAAHGFHDAEAQACAQNDLIGFYFVDLGHTLGQFRLIDGDVSAGDHAEGQKENVPGQNPERFGAGMFLPFVHRRAPEEDQRENNTHMYGADDHGIEDEDAQRCTQLENAQQRRQYEDDGSQFFTLKHAVS